MRLLLAAIVMATASADSISLTPTPTPTPSPEPEPAPVPEPTTSPTSTPTPNAECEAGFACPIGGSPVCGSDRTTYASDCALLVAQCENPSLVKIYDGECASPPTAEPSCDLGFTCPPGLEGSVCGSDGVTYSTLCDFLVAKCENPSLEIATDALCFAATPMPSNPFQMDVPTPKPECQAGYVCQPARDPVCGSDGKTYNNKCEMTVAQCLDDTLFIAGGGPCSAGTFDCSASCQRSQDLVCGSDGKTYDNECFLQRAKYCSPGDASIVVSSNGGCNQAHDNSATPNGRYVAAPTSTPSRTPSKTPSQTPSPAPPRPSSPATTSAPSSCDEIDCTSDKSPVCGSDGNTYINKCQLKRAQCSDSMLTLATTGECSSDTSISSVGKEADDRDFHASSNSTSLESLSSSSSTSSSSAGTGSSLDDTSLSLPINDSTPSSSGIDSSSLRGDSSSSSSAGDISSASLPSSASSSAIQVHFGSVGFLVAVLSVAFVF